MDLIIQRGRRLLDPDHQLRQRPPGHHHPRHPLSQPQVTNIGDGLSIMIRIIVDINCKEDDDNDDNHDNLLYRSSSTGKTVQLSSAQ